MSEVEREMVVETGALAAITKGEIDVQIATAHRYPRSIKRFRDEALAMVTLTEEIAQECIYALPREGKVIEGPSARFAEIVASAWGNCRAGARVVSETGEFVVSQGIFHDLERNVAIQYEVQRRITGKSGKRYSADMIGVTANAACSIALRNAILKGVPKAFWTSMYEAARQTVMGDFKTLANRRADAIKAFQAFGIGAEQVCRKLGVAGAEDLGLEHLVTLRGLLTAIREGDTTPEQAFAEEAQQQQDGKTRTEQIKERLRTPAPTEPEQAAPSSPAAPPSAEQPVSGRPTLQDCMALVRNGEFSMAQDFARSLTKVEQTAVEHAIKQAELATQI